MNNKSQIAAKIIFLTGRVDGIEKMIAMLQERLERDQDKIKELKGENELKNKVA